MARSAVSRGAAVGLDIVLFSTTVVTTLLYCRWFNDNVLAKGGVLLVGAGLLVVLLAVRALAGGGLALPRLAVYLPFALFFTWSLLSAARSHNPGLGLENALLYAAPFAVFLAAVHRLRDGAAVDRVIWLLVLLDICVSTIGLLQVVGVDLLPMPGKVPGVPVSTLGNQNFAAYYQDLMLPLLVALLLSPWTKSSRGRRVVVGYGAVAAAAQMVFSGSRAGWFSVGAALLVLLSLLLRRKPWPKGMVTLFVVVLLAVPLGQTFLSRVPLGRDETMYGSVARVGRKTWDRALTAFDPTDFSRSMRVLIWEGALDMIRTAPLLGAGPGQFWAAVPAHMDRESWQSLIDQRTSLPHEPRHAHNEYLEFAAEMGVVGLALAMWMFGSLLRTGLGHLRAGPGSAAEGYDELVRRALSAGVTCGLLAVFLHSFTSFNLHHPVVILHLWLLAGLMVAVNRSLSDVSSGEDGSFSTRTVAKSVVLGLGGAGVALLLGATGMRILLGDFYFKRGGRDLEIGNASAAALDFARAADWRGYEFRYYRILGRLASVGGQQAEARVALERSLALHPHDAGALRLLGSVLIRQNDPHAVEVLTRAVAEDRLDSKGYALLAQAYRAAGKFDSAAAVIDRRLKAAPDDPAMRLALAMLYRDQGKHEECVEVLEDLARTRPGDGVVAGNLGAAYLEAGRPADAEKQFRRAVELDPRNRAEWLTNLSQALVRQGRTEEARKAAVDAFKQVPDVQHRRRLLRKLARAVAGGR